MPALVNRSVGSLAGTSDDECTRLWSLLSKKRKNCSRISDPVGIVLFNSSRAKTCHRETEARRGFSHSETTPSKGVREISRVLGSGLGPEKNGRHCCRPTSGGRIEGESTIRALLLPEAENSCACDAAGAAGAPRAGLALSVAARA